MRNVSFLCVLLGFGAGCGAAPEAEGTATEQEQLVGWTGYVSEEQPDGVTCGDAGLAIRAAACRGSYCDDVALYCGAPHSRNTSDPDIPTRLGYWTSYISEESPNQIICPIGRDGVPSVIDGIRTSGSYSDDISIHCSQLAPAHYFVPGRCEWTPWFSEETGTQWFPPLVPRMPWTKVAVGVRCRGSYCDDMSYQVCEPQ